MLKIQGSGSYFLRLDNHTRTIVQNLKIDNDDYKDYTFDPNFDYKICYITPSVEGVLSIRLNDGSFQNIHNPVVNFTNHEDLPTYVIEIPADSGHLKPIDEQWTNGEELILTSALQDESCKEVPALLGFGDPPIFGELSDGIWLLVDLVRSIKGWIQYWEQSMLEVKKFIIRSGSDATTSMREI